MEAYVRDFLERLRYVDHASPETIRAYKTSLKIFMKFLEEKGTSIENVSTDTLVEFILWLGKRGLKKQSIGRHFYAIKKFLKTMKLDNHVDWAFLKISSSGSFTPTLLSEEEIRDMIAKAFTYNRQLALIIWLAYETGARISEIVNMKIEDIDFKECTIRIRPRKQREEELFAIPISDELCLALDYYIENKKPKIYLFEKSPGEKISDSSIRVRFMRFLKKHKLKKMRFHDIRHSRATNLLKKGLDIYVVSKILRHASVLSTEKYLHVSAQDLKKMLFEKTRENTKR